MPTTLTGLLLFVVLLMPGFAYLVGKERSGVERKMTAFRETVSIVTASIVSESVILAIFAVIRVVRPSIGPPVGRLPEQGASYLIAHYTEFAPWGAGLLLAATVLAYIASLPSLRLLLPFQCQYPHESTASAWWKLFQQWYPDDAKHIGCILDDGSYVEGRLASFNRSGDDLPDRDLILMSPLKYRPPDSDETSDYPAGALCVSASRIVVMFVSYLNEPTSASKEAEGVGSPASVALQSIPGSGPSPHQAG